MSERDKQCHTHSDGIKRRTPGRGVIRTQTFQFVLRGASTHKATAQMRGARVRSDISENSTSLAGAVEAQVVLDALSGILCVGKAREVVIVHDTHVAPVKIHVLRVHSDDDDEGLLSICMQYICSNYLLLCLYNRPTNQRTETSILKRQQHLARHTRPGLSIYRSVFVYISVLHWRKSPSGG